MKSDDKKSPVISRCQIITGKADKVFVDINTILMGETRVYDFGSNSAYFCIISDKPDELKLLSNDLLNYLHNSYLFIEIYKNTAPYLCIGISKACLKAYIPNIFTMFDSDVEEIFNKIKVEFTSKFSLFAFKYLEFHKDYNSSTFKFLFLQSYCLQFIYDFLRYLEVELNNNPNMKTQSMETKKVKEILQKVVSELYKTSPTVQQMATMAEMSVSKFKILFNNEFGESPHQHILGRKLIVARELLQTGSYSVSQVSYKVGFNHPSGFTRLFKHKFQYAPSELIPGNLI
jgi:AraC-like DNA-binding protein